MFVRSSLTLVTSLYQRPSSARRSALPGFPPQAQQWTVASINKWPLDMYVPLVLFRYNGATAYYSTQILARSIRYSRELWVFSFQLAGVECLDFRGFSRRIHDQKRKALVEAFRRFLSSRLFSYSVKSVKGLAAYWNVISHQNRRFPFSFFLYV